MPNHYHLLIRQDSTMSISSFIKSTFQSYVQSFNLRYGRTGQLFEGNVRGKLIGKENYLLHICRYIHLNPIEANLVKRLEDWEYSNYFEFIGARNGVLYDNNFVKEYFSDIGDYHSFILDNLIEKDGYSDIKKYVFSE